MGGAVRSVFGGGEKSAPAPAPTPAPAPAAVDTPQAMTKRRKQAEARAGVTTTGVQGPADFATKTLLGQ